MLRDSISEGRDPNTAYLKTKLQDSKISLDVVSRQNFRVVTSRFTLDISMDNKQTPQAVIDAFIKLHNALQDSGLNAEITEEQYENLKFH